MFILAVIVASVVSLFLVIGAISIYDESRSTSAMAGILVVMCLVGATWAQTHRVIDTQHVGITRSTFSQELAGPFRAGLVRKPVFGKVYQYPASSSFERCERYTPALEGSYGIVLDLCFYFDAGNIDWLAEVERTGHLDAESIMRVWRNSVVGAVAGTVKDSTPESLSNDRVIVEQHLLFEGVKPWFDARGIPLVRVSFKNWDFDSEEVAKAFDASIVSQRRITEQTALKSAAVISRQRELYEAETAKLVAAKQRESLDALGLTGDNAVQYLWIKLLSEHDKMPSTVILGNAPIAVTGH